MEDNPLPAGRFSSWLDSMQAALRGEGDSVVPCGACTACCRSAQFVHIDPDETETLAHIPAALQFPAPGLPEGHVLLGYDELGHCPMLVEDRCTIYEHRPRACRVYDCRVFAAAEVAPDEPTKADIAERVKRWRFELSEPRDLLRHRAVLAAAGFLRAHPETRSVRGPIDATVLAATAVEIHDAFLSSDSDTPVEPSVDAIRGRLSSRPTRGG